MTIVWAVLDPTSWQLFLSDEGASIAIFGILFLALFLNLVPDYISLVETRWILHRAAQAGVKKIFALLVLDVIVTAGIFVCGLGIIFLIEYVDSGYWPKVDEFLELLSTCIQFQPSGNRSMCGDLSVGVFFYSTYFTSVWLYLFITSSIATKLLYSLGRVGNRVLALLKVEEKPFQSMGLIAVGLLTLAFAISAIMDAIG